MIVYVIYAFIVQLRPDIIYEVVEFCEDYGNGVVLNVFKELLYVLELVEIEGALGKVHNEQGKGRREVLLDV